MIEVPYKPRRVRTGEVAIHLSSAFGLIVAVHDVWVCSHADGFSLEFRRHRLCTGKRLLSTEIA